MNVLLPDVHVCSAFGRSCCYRHTSQRGWGAAAPQTRAKPFFRAKAKFFGQKPAAKNGKKYFLYLLNGENGIHSVKRDKVPEIQDFY